jgi:fructoselysine-6-P-deglycase FrlB-like protein
MIAAEPAVARRIITRSIRSGEAAELGRAIRTALDAGAPVVITGCGTSETASQGMADILRQSLHDAGAMGIAVSAEQAFELSLDPPDRGLVIGVTHEGGTPATNAALRAARAAGARTAVVTASRRSPAAEVADRVVETGELDQAGATRSATSARC